MACAPDRIVSSSYLMLIIGCGPWPRGSCPAPPPSRLSAVTYAFPAAIRCSVSAPSVCLLGPARLLPNGTARTWTRAVSWRHSRVVLCSGLLRRRPAARSAAPWMVLAGSATASRAWDPAGSPEPVPCARAHQLSQRAVDRCNGNDATRLPTGLI